MKTRTFVAGLAFALALPVHAQTPLGTAFTYQGRLSDAGVSATGTYDFEFRLFDAATVGSQVGATVTKPGLAVSSGLFTTSLDFGASAFAGSPRWLEIAVKAPAAGAFTTLAPRQELTPTPNALWTAKAGEAAAVASASLVAPAAAGSVGVNTANPSGAALVVSGGPLQITTSDGFEDGTLAPFSSGDWTVTPAVISPFGGTISPVAGTYMARSRIGANSDSLMTFTFTTVTAARVSFAVRVRTEDGNYDYFHFLIDGVLRYGASGFFDWQRLSYDVGPGSHTLTWRYFSDGSVTLDGVFVDDLQIETSEPAIVAMGKVGIGTATPLDLLHVAGDVRVGTGTTGCVKDADASVIAGICSSDARFKTNVQPFAPMLDRVAQLQPVEFDWRAAEFPERGFGSRRSFGLIAQEVEELLPELVVTDAQGYKAVNYSRLPLVLLQALKEQRARLEAERARNDRLEEERAQNDRLEERLAELERKLRAGTGR